MNNNKGFTLIEIMVATIIFSAVAGISFTLLSQLRSEWGKRSSIKADYLSSSKNRILAFNTIDSLYDYFVKADTLIMGADKGYIPYFKGSALKMEFASLTSVFKFNTSAAVMLEIIENSDETYSLLYRERSLDEFYIKNFSDEINYNKEIILYKNLKQIDFHYYGITNISFSPKTMTSEKKYELLSEYSSGKYLRMPEKIIISLESSEIGFKKMEFIVKNNYPTKTKLFNPLFQVN